MKKLGLSMVCVWVALFLLMGTASAKDTVVVYTSLENEEIVDYLELAKKELPDLDIQAIRLSTGELGARMLAEKDNPQADCIWGWAVTNTSEFVPKGMLVPYKPKGWDKIPDNFKDPKGYWTAIDLYAAAFVGNTKVLEKDGLSMAKSWNDLLKPDYKGKLIMPNPASSGTGFLQVASLLVMLDPDYKNKAVEKNKVMPIDPRILTNVVLSHAHIDHSGRLPLLARNAFRGLPGLLADALPDRFGQRLDASLHFWEEQGLKVVWLEIPIDKTALIPIAVEAGFVFHHSGQDYVMMTRQLVDGAFIPPYATHYIGAGGVVVNERQELLVVWERAHRQRGAKYYKLPGGALQQGEHIVDCVKREVLEETGIETQFEGLVCFRHWHGYRYDKSDIYFVCRLSPLNHRITPDEHEIEECLWMPVKEYLASEDVGVEQATLVALRECRALVGEGWPSGAAGTCFKSPARTSSSSRTIWRSIDLLMMSACRQRSRISSGIRLRLNVSVITVRDLPSLRAISSWV